MSIRQRTSVRFPYHESVTVRSQGSGARSVLQALNVTPGGLFLCAEVLPALQSEVEVELSVPDGGTVWLRARVVRVVTPQIARESGVDAGMALCFENCGESEQRALDAIVQVARAHDPRPRVPLAVAAVARNRPLTDPMLDYVLQHADGTRSPEALAQAIGLETDVVAEMVCQLRELGLVQLVALSSRPDALSARPPTAREHALDLPSARASGAVPARALTEVHPELQSALDEIAARLEHQDHFQVLGATKNADREEILRAFRALADKFDPDRYQSRELVSLRSTLRRIFGKLNDACSVLCNPEARALYEAYLARAETLAVQDRGEVSPPLSLAALATMHEAQARYDEDRQDWERAALSWTRVYEIHPDDPTCARHAARALLQARRELRRAQSFAERALALEPENPANHRLLARIFIECGLRLRARKQLQLAAEVERRHTAKPTARVQRPR
jgi:curved DNA-binding protein CbpA